MAQQTSVFEDIGTGISDAANAVALVVEDVVNAVEEAVADVLETVGNFIEDVLTAFGDWLGGLPVFGGILRGSFHWIGDVISGAFDLAAAIVKGVLGIVAGIVAGVLRVIGGGIGGLLAWDGRPFVKGSGDILSGIFGAVVVIGGKAIAVIQQIIPLQWGERALTDEEREVLERVFRRSVALYNVRIIEGFAGLFSLNDRPFTLGNTIYMKDRDPAAEPGLLIHECVHVWQYQNIGTRYASDALAAQWFTTDEYDWEREIGRGNSRWVDFNREAQGKFFEDLYDEGRKMGMPPTTGDGVFFEDDPIGGDVEFLRGSDHTPLGREAVAHVRGAWAWRLSILL